VRQPHQVAGHQESGTKWGRNTPALHDLSYSLRMTERVEFDVDETTAAYLHRCAHQRGVSVGASAARQLRELALADAARALAAWDPTGAYAEAQTEEREHAAAS
jgi:hypothetical protein